MGTFYAQPGVAVGFGRPTFEMKSILRDTGLEISNENNQYADHMGIEILLASELCRRIAEDPEEKSAENLAGYLQNHPLSWIDSLVAAVSDAKPADYIKRILELVEALMVEIAR